MFRTTRFVHQSAFHIPLFTYCKRSFSNQPYRFLRNTSKNNTLITPPLTNTTKQFTQNNIHTVEIVKKQSSEEELSNCTEIGILLGIAVGSGIGFYNGVQEYLNIDYDTNYIGYDATLVTVGLFTATGMLSGGLIGGLVSGVPILGIPIFITVSGLYYLKQYKKNKKDLLKRERRRFNFR